MNRFLPLCLLIFCVSHVTHAENRNVLPEASQSEDVIKRNKEIEQEIADFDSFVNENIVEIADETGIIQVKIIIYKDHNEHNKLDWENIIKKTAQSCSRIRTCQLLNNKAINIQEEINTIINNLANDNNDNGIITEFSIETSDGIPVKGCCGNDCTCIDRYKGNCPCSLDNNVNRCLFPEEELPFDDMYEEIEETNHDNTEDESSYEMFFDDSDSDDEFDVQKKRRCCR